ncbi:hypothetical protein GIB67_018830 [Kingdonia uniflora]|uniref:Helitron helicase-like domain-containing protein n=1 Tax=Kingdonia uniflora TaxID=39325 RepID=A0A7J7NDY3_9MAGN|nr:hypothetical protein GIB67_018830 [Kingdonia uniflora]
MDYYLYRLFQRLIEYSAILRSGKLFLRIYGRFLGCDREKLYKIRYKYQGKLRSELYGDLKDLVGVGLNSKDVGKRLILPSSFIGGPRHMLEIFQDSMAITRHNNHQYIFLTMTANPNQIATERPDLVARVFKLKRRALMREIKKGKVFGPVVAYVYTIEFQKRRLPYMHALFFLQQSHKICNRDQVYKIISAEFPDESIDPTLYQTIKRCMIYGPCGNRNPQMACMENEKYTKRYPRIYTKTTTMDTDGYPVYRRRETNTVHCLANGQQVDNRDVVPHNPYLTRMFDCHINVAYV